MIFRNTDRKLMVYIRCKFPECIPTAQHKQSGIESNNQAAYNKDIFGPYLPVVLFSQQLLLYSYMWLVSTHHLAHISCLHYLKQQNTLESNTLSI